jgi:hypothetical protein
MISTEESGAPAAKKQRLQMPDEYLPPNSVLFIQNLPEGTTSDDLREVFELSVDSLLPCRISPTNTLQARWARRDSYYPR